MGINQGQQEGARAMLDEQGEGVLERPREVLVVDDEGVPIVVGSAPIEASDPDDWTESRGLGEQEEEGG